MHLKYNEKMVYSRAMTLIKLLKKLFSRDFQILVLAQLPTFGINFLASSKQTQLPIVPHGDEQPGVKIKWVGQPGVANLNLHALMSLLLRPICTKNIILSID